MATQSLIDFINALGNANNTSLYSPNEDVYKKLGLGPMGGADWAYVGNPTPGDSGDPIGGYQLSPEAAARLADYQVTPTGSTSDYNQYALNGNGANEQLQTKIDKDSWFDKFGMMAPFLLGGYGLLSGGAGAASAAEGAAASSVTPEMIAAANATADPIAALNASAGWTGVDSAYLAGMGAAPTAVDSLAAYTDSLAKGVTPWETSLAGPAAATAALPELAPGVGGLFEAGALTMPAWDYGALTDSLPDALKGLTAGAIPSIGGAPGATPGTTPTPAKTPDASAAVPGAASSIPDWLKKNGKWLAPLLGAGMGLLDGGESSGGGYKDSGYRPTINRGGWSPSAAQAPSVKANIGLLNMPTTGVENAGLWRFLNR